MLIKDRTKDSQNENINLNILYDKQKNIEEEIKEIDLELTKIKNDLSEIKKSMDTLMKSLSTLNVISTKISSIEFILNEKMDRKVDEIISTILTHSEGQKEKKTRKKKE